VGRHRAAVLAYEYAAGARGDLQNVGIRKPVEPGVRCRSDINFWRDTP
jgi:hypothetical protein